MLFAKRIALVKQAYLFHNSTLCAESQWFGEKIVLLTEVDSVAYRQSMYNRVMVKLIILRGYPGSGKKTIGKALEAEGLGKFVDHNAILTFIANIVGDDEGIYDDIVNLPF